MIKITSIDIKSQTVLPQIKREEYTKVYENCVKIISSRFYLIKLVDIYIEDSQALSGIIRLFRKVTQTLTNFHAKNLIMDKINISPKVFATEFKVIL